MQRRGSSSQTAVAEFKLSARAEADLIEIYQYTEGTYGTYQAEAYVAGLERTFDLLAHFPRMGAAIDEIAAGCRRFRFQAHVVFYSEQPSHVIIRAVLHHSRQIRPGLFD
ncbi:type II toxin-antitoxin system RelE/ParE family toxin [Bradyrhizobium oligotrophicum S58]